MLRSSTAKAEQSPQPEKPADHTNHNLRLSKRIESATFLRTPKPTKAHTGDCPPDSTSHHQAPKQQDSGFRGPKTPQKPTKAHHLTDSQLGHTTTSCASATGHRVPRSRTLKPTKAESQAPSSHSQSRHQPRHPRKPIHEPPSPHYCWEAKTATTESPKPITIART